MNKEQEIYYLSYIDKLKKENKVNYLDFILDKESICKINIKVLSAIMDKFYIKGDEVSIKNLIKDNIECIPIEIFRYLLLFVADKQIKMKIYFHVLDKNRLDLLSSIKGLTTKDYDLIYKSLRDEDKKMLLMKEIKKSIKRESVSKYKRKMLKDSVIKMYKTSKK